MSGEIDANTQVSHEQDGRVLSGVGVSADRLAETMERHAPESKESPAGPAVAPTAEGGETAATPAPDKPSRGQQRFSELAKARDTEKARADAAEARAAAAEAKIAAPPPAPVAAAEPAKPAEKPAAAPEKFTFPTWEKFLETNPNVSYDEWELERFAAYDAWKDARVDVGARVRETIAAERARAHAEESVEATRVKGRAAYADFDEALTTGPGAKIDLHADPATANQRVSAIFRHPQSEHLQYAIMKDAALATKLAAMDDVSFGMALAALVPAPAAPRAAHTPPPAPYTPVNGNGPTSVTPSGALASKGFDFDKSGYREKRSAERKSGRR